jgi:hypothetical protein
VVLGWFSGARGIDGSMQSCNPHVHMPCCPGVYHCSVLLWHHTWRHARTSASPKVSATLSLHLRLMWCLCGVRVLFMFVCCSFTAGEACVWHPAEDGPHQQPAPQTRQPTTATQITQQTRSRCRQGCRPLRNILSSSSSSGSCAAQEGCEEGSSSTGSSAGSSRHHSGAAHTYPTPATCAHAGPSAIPAPAMLGQATSSCGPGYSRAGHSRARHSRARHSRARHRRQGHSRAGHSRARHSRAGHSRARHKRQGHSRARHRRQGHSRAGHSRQRYSGPGSSRARYSRAGHNGAAGAKGRRGQWL